MAGARSNNKKPPTQPAPNGQDAVVAMARSIWAATEQADPQTRAWLQKVVVDCVGRIERQVTGKLKMATLLCAPGRNAATAPIAELGRQPGKPYR